MCIFTCMYIYMCIFEGGVVASCLKNCSNSFFPSEENALRPTLSSAGEGVI